MQSKDSSTRSITLKYLKNLDEERTSKREKAESMEYGTMIQIDIRTPETSGGQTARRQTNKIYGERISRMSNAAMGRRREEERSAHKS